MPKGYLCPSILLIIFLSIFISSDCQFIKYNCGKGPYTCDGMFYTLPYENPIKFDSYNNVILYADGMLVHKRFNGQNTYNLNQICGSDTITDFAVYDWHIINRNNLPYGVPLYYDGFVLVLSPQVCYKMSWFENVLLEFGNVGHDSVLLVDAEKVDINYLQQIFVLDYGDRSIKIFNKFGDFLSKWANIGRPKFFKIFDEKVWILDETDQSIRVYDFNGDVLGTAANSRQWNNIISFKLNSGNSIWISDYNGKRLSLYSRGEILYEFHSNFCYMDATFYFGRIVSLEGHYGVTAVDKEKNLIIDFIEDF
jgi:hypothetical protein